MNSKLLIGWSAVVIGVIAAVSAFVVSSTLAGRGLAFGFAAFIAFFGALSVLARNRTPDHWGLVVVGLAMFVVPFMSSGYNYDPGASWTCWVAGGLALTLGGVGWTRDKAESQDGMSEWGDSQHLRNGWSLWIGRSALVVGFAIGLVVCTLVGRALGLLATDDITRYTARHRQDVGGAAAARRRLRPRQGRIRSTAAAPFVRFS